MEPVEHRLEDWKKRLIDLTRRNRLLHYKPTKTSSLCLTAPTCSTVFERLAIQNKSWRIWLPSEEAEEEEAQDGEHIVIRAETRLFESDELGFSAPNSKRSTAATKGRSGKGTSFPLKSDEILVGRIQRVITDPSHPVPLRWDALFGTTVPIRKELERSLLQLQRRSRTDYQERGVRTAYVTFGALLWKEVVDSRPIISPLLMCPVALTSSTKDPYTIEPVGEELVLNPALAVKLQNDFRLELPPIPEDWDEISLQDYLGQIADAVASRQWVVDTVGLLDLFSFHKLVMYDDLKRNAARIAAHPILRTLVGMEEGIESQPGSALPGENEIDRIQHPERTFQVLDADSSQQACIQAVLQGHSIVLQGPPGTGKSQTIANVIAEMMARGKTVLFVAEKMAALEVVSKRLRDVGLGDLCLEAHSRMASKKEVIASLKAALDNDLEPQQRVSNADFAHLTELRSQLNSYILALHERRSPSERSVFEVLGELAKSHLVPGYTLSGVDLLSMTRSDFSRWEGTFKQVRDLWAVAQEGTHHPWFGCQTPNYTFEVKEMWRTRLRDLQANLSQLRRHGVETASALGIAESTDFETLELYVALGRHLRQIPSIETTWLEAASLSEMVAESVELGAVVERYYQKKREFEQKYRPGVWGKSLWDEPLQLSARLSQAWESANRCLEPFGSPGAELFAARDDLAHFVERTLDWLHVGQTTSGALQNVFALNVRELTPWHTEQIARFALLCNQPTKPEASWFDPAAFLTARQMVDSTGRQVEDYRRRTDALTQRHGAGFWAISLESFVPSAEDWLKNYQSENLKNVPLTNSGAIFSTLSEHTCDETQQLKEAALTVQSWHDAMQSLAQRLGIECENLSPQRSNELGELAQDIVDHGATSPAAWAQPHHVRRVRGFIDSAQPLAEEASACRHRILSQMKAEMLSEPVERWKNVFFSFQEQPNQTPLLALGGLVSRWQSLEVTPSNALQSVKRFLDEWCGHLATVSSTLGLHADSITAARIPHLQEIIALCLQPDHPERAWLNHTDSEAAFRIVEATQPLFQEYLQRREALLEHYDEALFDLDLDGLRERFHSASHKLPLCWLHPAYKADRREMLRVLRSPQLPSTIAEDLVEAREVVRLQRRVKETFPALQAQLGRYFAAEKTDFEAVLRGLIVARKVQPLLETRWKTEAVVELLVGATAPPDILRSVHDGYQNALSNWERVVPVLVSLIPTQTIADLQRLREINSHLEALSRPLEDLLEGYFTGLETQWSAFDASLHLLERTFAMTGKGADAPLPSPLIRLLVKTNATSLDEEITNRREPSSEGVLQSAQSSIREILVRLNRCRAEWDAHLDRWVRLCPLDDLREGWACHNLKQSIEARQPQMDEVLGAFSQGIETDFNAVRQALTTIAQAQELWSSGPRWDNGQVEGAGLSYSLPLHLQAVITGTYGEDISVSAPQLFEMGRRFLESTEQWTQLADKWQAYLPAKEWGLEKGWRQLGWSQIEAWSRAVREPLKEIQNIGGAVLSHCQSDYRPDDLLTLLSDCREAEAIRAVETDFEDTFTERRAQFGISYQGLDTDWKALEQALRWTLDLRLLTDVVGLSDELCALCTERGRRVPDVEKLSTALHAVEALVEAIRADFKTPNGLPGNWAEAWQNHVALMMDRLDELELWTDYQKQVRHLRASPLDGAVREMMANPPAADQLLASFHKTVWQKWVDNIFDSDPRLKDFRSQHHNDLIAQFRDIDQRLIRFASGRIAEAYSERKPKALGFGGPNSEVALLRNQAGKKSRHLPLGKLVARIPNLLPRLKPCLMMSPLTVSQYLPVDALTFDLVIFDEASQIFTEDAVGAIYRGKQLLVAGDSKQLPPSNFFSGIDSEEDHDLDEEIDLASDFRSLLDEGAVRLPEKFLRWHYRSRHESLIAFSNHRFYNDRLFTFPSPLHAGEELGVELAYVPDGVYDRGKSKKNMREAEVVAERVFQHFARFPDKSLGVVAFSKSQAEAIEDAIRLKRKAQRELESFFSNEDDRLGGFFVKNLENVQGDERDCIIFSLGYGFDGNRSLSMNFGPLNNAGGERRLNVAITRARDKVILVSSLRASDLDLEKINAPGVLNLYHYLDYAERGDQALSLVAPLGGDTESPFEDEVKATVRELGYHAVSQVGCSGYRIDLAVVHPSEPGRFVLAIECDGATYHSSATARDRDRLRQQILENLGWRVHRIWSPDWVRSRDREVQKLKEAIDRARRDVWSHSNKNDTSTGASRSGENTTLMSAPLKTVPVVDTFEALPGTQSYTVYEDGSLPGFRFGSFLDDPFLKQEARLEQVVKTEGPIHRELALRRVCSGTRLSTPVVEIFEECVRRCERNRLLIVRGDFLWKAQQSSIVVRVPDLNFSETRREVEFIPSEELREALIVVLRHTLGQSQGDLLKDTARLMGWNRVGDKIRRRLEHELKVVVKQGTIEELNGQLSLPASK